MDVPGQHHRPWLLAAFVLALSPALVWALWRHSDPRNRAQVLTVAAGAGALLMAMYPLFALFKR